MSLNLKRFTQIDLINPLENKMLEKIFGKSLESILDVFTKTLVELDEYMERTELAIETNGVMISKLEDASKTMNDNFTKAFESRKKIAEIVGG